MPNTPFFKVSHVRKSYSETGETLHILNGVNLELNAGELVAIVGSSGAGKSTLLNILGGLDLPDEGQIFFKGQNVSDLKSKELDLFRQKNVGLIFQFHHLLPELTALENVMLPGQILAEKKEAQILEHAQKLLAEVGLSARAKHFPSELSGGERQRVAIARALMNSPSIVLADEPSGNLDTVNSRKLHELFFELNQKLGITFVIVTHDLHFAELATRRLEMRDGILNEV